MKNKENPVLSLPENSNADIYGFEKQQYSGIYQILLILKNGVFLYLFIFFLLKTIDKMCFICYNISVIKQNTYDIEGGYINDTE